MRVAFILENIQRALVAKARFTMRTRLRPMKALIVIDRIREFFLAATTYVVIPVSFLFGLITSRGDVAQGDWGIPITASAALSDLKYRLFVWQFGGFGEGGTGRFGFPFFPLLNAALAPLGLVGGTEVKVLSVSLVALGGITTYILARSFGLGFFSSFLSGLFFMTTPVVFNWLVFGWIYYLIAYDLIPVMILVTKKFLETNDIRYALINGIILSIATAQPTFILVYPLLAFLFALFESRGNRKIIVRGLIITTISLSIWLLTSLSFFTSYNNAGTFSFYLGDYHGVIQAQFRNLSSLLNPIRLWGSTFNYQFETYFPKDLVLLSFMPLLIAALGILLRPRDRRVLFFAVAYLFVYVSCQLTNNLSYLVYNLPYGTIFEAPSIFLIPASLGLALLIGFTNQSISRTIVKFKNVASRVLVRNVSSIIILILIISAAIPWWTGQASGNPIPGPPVKLNMYQIPSGYREWSNVVAADDEYFVLYVPLSPNPQIMNTSYFSLPFEGVNGGVFTQINNLPYVSFSNTTLLLNDLVKGDSQVGEIWGSYSIKYIVVYTNVQSAYNMTDLINRLSKQSGIVKVASLPDVVVYKNEYAKPVIYTNSPNATTQITYNDPSSYKVLANSTSPYLLVLNQVFASGWIASVNGTALPNEAHLKDDNGFNSWYINYTGTMTIDIYYEPQTIYFMSTIVSTIVLVVIVLYLVLATVKDVRRAHR